MSKKRIKKAIDDQISDKPLFTNEDRQRFYANKQNSRFLWLHQAFPKLLTVMTALLMLTGSLYFFTSENPLQSPASPNEDKFIEGPDKKEEKGKEEEEEEVKETTLDLDTKIERIKEVVINQTKEQKIRELVQDFNGKEIKASQEEETERLSFIFPSDSEVPDTADPSHTPPSIEAYQNNELDLFLVVQWSEEYNIFTSAELIYLSEDRKSLTKEKYDINRTQRDFVKVVGADEPVSMQDLLLRSIARSLDKEPDTLTKGDLLDLEELTINASHLTETFHVDADTEYFKAMKSLKVLKLNQALIPGELLKEVPTLEQVTFIGSTVNDLSQVSEGMQNVQYLNLINSSFQGTAEDILKLKSLTIVRVDPAVVPEYEELQFEGIDVRW